jgi:diaminopimelate epimerase
MIFYKTVCSGNDFIHIDLEETDLSRDQQKSELARVICNRNSGAGADGVVYYRIQKKSADFQIYNQDGTRAELSGNGMAGLASLLFQLNHFRDGIILNTGVGKKAVELIERKGNKFKLRIEIGEPNFQQDEFFPFLESNRIEYRYQNIAFVPVSVGNPHAVVLLSEFFSDHKLQAMAKELASAPIFPQGTNVELVCQDAEKPLRIFYYERGVGRTLFSSTGSAAVFAVMQCLKKIHDSLSFPTPSENIKISGTRKIYLENFCKIVYKGIYWK